MDRWLAQVTTGCVGITSGASRKLGKYPSELNWSSLGDVLGFIYVQECAQTKLCYEWQPMANEEWGKGLSAMNSKRGAYHDKDSPTQPLGIGYDVIDKL